ncbi:BadF/BadG/BcrA/BcrD ATPase family protein [Thalassotalea sp. 1_MG-2023]|uniref:N-acetylglucosamine kinase n=1 Tax=Thalassotalea sp. 1_MG-2023 TaxID=3062680 RepID=UPI0026E380E8|nr:BadF/BadG/BcrA/BcrD ATPase family protein [Thalassotalea sp. 1_MG-2023]MDO6428813.1 BadF/BadG/BcrA/BcrD ATPase family protein [Thalassotalea sp. 1_MG-2023]
MPSSSDINNTYFLGIDGGGSKCKAIIVDADNKVLGEGISGPANPLHGFEQAVNSITESAHIALKASGLNLQLSDLTAGVGLAGVNLPALFEQMSNWQHPFGKMFLATDLLIACLAAHNGDDGAVMITGTGSCGFSYVDGHPYTIGGHGFPHGDKGSGAWFGFQAANYVLMSLDGLKAPSMINEKLLTLLDVKDGLQMVEAIAGKPAAFYARLANLVFDAAEQGDFAAKAIVEEGACYISGVARQLEKQNPPRISLIGGLTPRIKPWLDEDIKHKLAEPICAPEMGSVIFAQQQLALL